MIGELVAHYQVIGKLGAGGMGEVYRAADTRLNRQVALKVLPQVFARDEQRMARFEREAQVLASLNHPNIASIYGLEEASGTRILIMELVEGQDLSERIALGAIPLEETVQIALQIVEGLESAHQKGIIHRDLKPANIKLSPEGKVKLLDFGLAKALEDPIPSPKSGELSHSPTLSLAATQAGVILGSAAYMSPEQARGKPVDKRSDIWSFGVVLYEMVTGKRPFQGEDLTETLASVVKDEPDLSAVPPELRRLLGRCLAKDPRKRAHDIADVRLDLEEAQSEQGTSRVNTQPAGPERWRTPLLAGVAGLVLGALLWAGLGGIGESPEPFAAPRLRATQIPLLSGTPLFSEGRQITISPDGEEIVFAAGKLTDTRIYRRQLDRFEIEEIPGTEGGRNPFFFPDGQWLALVQRPKKGQVFSFVLLSWVRI